MSPEAAFGGVVFFFLILNVILAAVCGNIWSKKGGSAGIGFLIGFFLGVIGLVIVLVASPGSTGLEGARCPYCAEFVQPAARVCKHCGRDLPLRACPHCNTQIAATAERCPNCKHSSPAWRLHEGRWWKREGKDDYWYDNATQAWQPYQS